MRMRPAAYGSALALAALICGCPGSGSDSGTGGTDSGTDSGSEPMCGNDLAELGEVCDGTDVGGWTCASIGKGFAAGTLGCLADCSELDTSSCDYADFSCLGMNDPPPPTSAIGTITLRVEDFVNAGMSIPDVVVTGYDLSDVMMTNPVATATTDAAGDATLSVPLGATGWDGFLSLVPMDPILKTSYNYQNKPYTADTTDLEVLPGVDGTTWALFHTFGGTSPDPALGVIGLALEDCAGNGVPGMSFTATPSDPATVIVYLRNGFPNPGATASDPDGSGVAFGSATGPITLEISAPPMPGMPSMLIATTSVSVRPDALTTVAATPD